MNLELVRKSFTDKSTIGKLYINGVYECMVLEDTVRDTKILGQTAIPYGEYEVKITYSPRFKRDLPLLLNVPNFEGVRIHTGNTAKDTEGCLIIGQIAGQDIVWQSQLAFNALFPKLKTAQDAGKKITLKVTK